jgi:hypothetical protein
LGLVYLMRWLRTRWSWGRRGEEEGLEPVEVLGVRDVEKVGEGGGNALQAARTVE